MKKRVLVPLFPGFEEIEAVTLLDVLRRAGVEVLSAGPTKGPIEGSRGVRVEADASLAELEGATFDAIVLPGGMGGTMAMVEDERLLGLLRRHYDAGRLTAAICAAPLALARAGIAAGRRLTAHPSVHDRLGEARLEKAERVVREGNLLTSQGPGTAMEFALALVGALVSEEKAEELARGMVVARP